MADGIYTALTGAIAQQQTLDVIANNVANVTTAGYRADRASFSEFLAGAQKTQLAAVTADGQPAPRVDHFVHIDAVTRDQQDGVLKQTGNPLDMALSGDGFFVVQTDGGERLTRAGNFMLRTNNVLTTSDGHDVLGDNGRPITLSSAKNIQVSTDGVIQSDGHVVGKLKLVRAQDPAQLEKESATLYKPVDGALMETAQVTVTQGHIEASNVNAVAGINDLITVNRSFDALQRVIETFQKLDERTARELGSRNG
jgi:flagellar basal-body rod protein FlgF